MDIVVPESFKYLYERNASRPVFKIPDPILRTVCAPITEIGPHHRDLIKRMMKAMDLANGVGLAAPQMGEAVRIIVVAPGETKPLALINPEIVEHSGEQIGQEGCLSIPGLYGDVLRAETVVVDAYDHTGKPVRYEMDGIAARVIQHEVDHLDGVLFTDKVDVATLHWMNPEIDED